MKNITPRASLLIGRNIFRRGTANNRLLNVIDGKQIAETKKERKDSLDFFIINNDLNRICLKIIWLLDGARLWPNSFSFPGNILIAVLNCEIAHFGPYP